jgi:hypothetical protein
MEDGDVGRGGLAVRYGPWTTTPPQPWRGGAPPRLRGHRRARGAHPAPGRRRATCDVRLGQPVRYVGVRRGGGHGCPSHHAVDAVLHGPVTVLSLLATCRSAVVPRVRPRRGYAVLSTHTPCLTPSVRFNKRIVEKRLGRIEKRGGRGREKKQVDDMWSHL